MNSELQIYTVYWKHNKGYSGHGEKPTTYNLAKAWVDHLNKKYPDMHHWVQ